MHNFVIILEFIGGVLLLFAIGWLVGYLFRLENPHHSSHNMDPRINTEDDEN